MIRNSWTYYYRYSKFETLLMAHNWHWVSSMGTNIKLNIFGTLPLTIANVNERIYSQHYFKHDDIYKYYHLFRFLNQNCGRSFILNKKSCHFRNKAQFCIFVHFTKSCFCRDFITKQLKTHFLNNTSCENLTQKWNNIFGLLSILFPKFNPAYFFKCFCLNCELCELAVCTVYLYS